jgi:hypothetical protein
VENLIWLDAGVEGVTVLDKHIHQLTSEEKEAIESSGFSGQVVTGLKYRGETILEPVGRIYPNILEDAHTAFPGQSCGALIINNPQRCATNKMAAQLANNYMNNLFHTYTIYTNYVNFNAQYGGSRPTFISQAAIDQYEKLKRQFGNK